LHTSRQVGKISVLHVCRAVHPVYFQAAIEIRMKINESLGNERRGHPVNRRDIRPRNTGIMPLEDRLGEKKQNHCDDKKHHEKNPGWKGGFFALVPTTHLINIRIYCLYFKHWCISSYGWT